MFINDRRVNVSADPASTGSASVDPDLMANSKFMAPAESTRERLLGCWRLLEYSETPEGGQPRYRLGAHPLGTILYTCDGYVSAQLAMSPPYVQQDRPTAYALAYSGPFDVDEQTGMVAHHVVVSVIPSWLGTTQLRKVHFPEAGMLVLSATEPIGPRGTLTAIRVTWLREPPR